MILVGICTVLGGWSDGEVGRAIGMEVKGSIKGNLHSAGAGGRGWKKRGGRDLRGNWLEAVKLVVTVGMEGEKEISEIQKSKFEFQCEHGGAQRVSVSNQGALPFWCIWLVRGSAQVMAQVFGTQFQF